MITERERVTKCLEFDSPDRAPRDLWVLPATSMFQSKNLNDLLEAFPLDISRPELSPGWADERGESTALTGKYRDEWGSLWHIAEPGVIGEVKQPALDNWSKLKTFSPPWHIIDENKDSGYINGKCEESDKFMLSEVCARPFERLQFVRGTENVFLDMAYGADKLDKLVSMIHEFNLRHIEFWCRTDVDGVFIMDDWGANTSLLISPEIFRNTFKPLYREYCELIHSYDKYVFFHSDGNIEQIFGDFIEVGVDAINSQLFTMNIENLAAKYKGQITFWGEMDRQRILPFGTPEEVREAVRRVRHCLDDGTGGVIGQCEWGKNNPRENIAEVFKAWSEALC